MMYCNREFWSVLLSRPFDQNNDRLTILFHITATEPVELQCHFLPKRAKIDIIFGQKVRKRYMFKYNIVFSLNKYNLLWVGAIWCLWRTNFEFGWIWAHPFLVSSYRYMMVFHGIEHAHVRPYMTRRSIPLQLHDTRVRTRVRTCTT